jgi:hypothetical protein
MIIQCPKCGQSIPNTNQVCQFCQTPIPINLRGAVQKQNLYHVEGEPQAGSGFPPETVWNVYAKLTVAWITFALLDLVLTIIVELAMTKGEIEFTPGLAIGILISVIKIILGFGLLQKWDAVRQFVSLISIIGLIRGLVTLAFSTMSIIVLGVFGLLFTIVTLFSLAINAAMIWAISETDRLIALDRMNRR